MHAQAQDQGQAQAPARAEAAQSSAMLGEQTRQCIRECLDCHSACMQTARYCLQQGGRFAEPGHITLLLDCADICQSSASFMLRGSPLHGRTCGLCAEICERCERACAAFGRDNTTTACAEACRRCAEACQRMSADA